MYYVEQNTISGRSVAGFSSDSAATRAFHRARAILSACGMPHSLRVVNARGEVIEQSEFD